MGKKMNRHFPEGRHIPSPTGTLYIVPLNNAKCVWLYPAGPWGPEARAAAVLSWHRVAEMSFFNYVVLRESIIHC